MTTIVITTAKASSKVTQFSARHIEASFSLRPKLSSIGVVPSVVTSAATRSREELRQYKVMMIAAAFHANCPCGWLNYTLGWSDDARSNELGHR